LASAIGCHYEEAMIGRCHWMEFSQDTRVTPLLFTRSAMGFLMTTESQDLDFTSQRTVLVTV